MRKILLLIFLSIALQLFSQTTESLIPHIPSSPQSEAFNRYGNYSISYSTGIPDISIPLYEINHYGYKIPIILKYSPQPLKPGYNYDVIGQGWALSASGSISRTIEYEPDELKDFVLDIPGNDFIKLCSNSCLLYKNYALDKFKAVLPDGTSFEFVIEKKNGVRNFTVSDGRNLKIECNVGNSQINWFKVVDENGVKYTFDGSDSPYQGPNNIYSQHYVSWQLTRIDLPNSPEPILFSNNILIQSPYHTTCPESVIKFGHSFNPNYYYDGEPSAHTYFATKTQEYTSYSYKMRLLTEISFGPQGKSKLKLLYKNNSESAYNYIDNIQLWESTSLVKEIKPLLSIYNLGGQCGATIAKLNSLAISDGSLQGPTQQYRFVYTSTPSAFSGTDHWGNRSYAGNYAMPNFTFFSQWNMADGGFASNAGMMSITKIATDVTPFYKFSLSNYPYSDTRSSEEPSAHGVLQKIEYPTGGYTIFEFENHRFFSHSNFDGNYIYDKVNRVIRHGGGFRIKTIENYSDTDVRTDKRNFRYGKTYLQIPGSYGNLNYPNAHTGAGFPQVDPNILTYMNYSSFQVDFPIRNMILGLDVSGNRQTFADPFISSAMQNHRWSWDATFSALNFRRILNGRSPVLYDQVSVYEGDIDEYANIFPLGKTVYTYDLRGANYGEEIFEEPQYFGNIIGYIPKSYRYDKLINKTDYEFDVTAGVFKKVKSESNNWNWVSMSSNDYQYTNPYPQGREPAWLTTSQVFTGKPFYIGYAQLQNKRTVEYSTETDSLAVSETNSFNSRGQISQKEVFTSDNQIRKTKFEYPDIVLNQPTPQVIQDMLERNIIAPILKTSIHADQPYVTTGDQIIASKKVKYSFFGSNQLLPNSQYALEIKPSLTEYVLRHEVKSYSVNGNPLEVWSENQLPTTYLWGYGDRYLIAQVKNAKRNEILFDNFEENTLWDTGITAYDQHFAHTGNVSGRIDKVTQGEQVSHSGQWLSINLTAPRKFKYSGWVYSNGPSAQLWLFMKRAGEAGYYSYVDQVETAQTGRWVYLEKDFEVPADVVQLGIRLDNNGGGSVWFDDIRLHPSDTQMVSYTYKPLVGMTSDTDTRGMTNYYEYDGLQRLKTIRDYEGKIKKSYDYHYRP